MEIEKYSFGVGDRFGHEGKAQLQAIIKAKEAGVDIVPVWNKSHREHSIIKTSPDDVRVEADDAVKALGWEGSYYVDADHIGLKNVDLFMASSDFFTLDVADFIGEGSDPDDVKTFVEKYSKYVGSVSIPGIDGGLEISAEQIESIGVKYLGAIKEAGKIYRHIEAAKGAGNFVTEVSMDETDQPQTPDEMLF
ncbi:MAG: tagaturonate epimerase family protein, partial [Planctomycetota bacterium]